MKKRLLVYLFIMLFLMLIAVITNNVNVAIFLSLLSISEILWHIYLKLCEVIK